VAREADTERAFTGTMWSSETKGTYYCAACGNLLFKSNQKFVSSCGWPSFFEQDNKESITFKPDNSYGMQRIELIVDAVIVIWGICLMTVLPQLESAIV